MVKQMKDYKILKLMDYVKGIFTKFGIDYPVMRSILQLKLTMDSRRVSTIMSQNNTKVKKEKNNYISSLWIYVLFGLLLTPLMFIGDSYIFSMSMILSVYMFLIITSLISDFSSVLLDIRDKNILMTKPVDSRTVNMAKGIHIFIYLFSLTLAISISGLVTALIRNGVFFLLVFILMLILMNLMVIAITAIFYTIILKYFNGEKLKDVINYVQIGFTLVITVGFQLVSRLFQFIDFNYVFQPKWWQFFIPPMWFGAPFEVLFNGEYNITYIVFSILSVIVPIVAILGYIKLIPTFEKNLSKLNENSSKQKKKKKSIFDRIPILISKDKEEENFYRFAKSMMKNEREFKLKVYPALGFSFVFPYIFLMNQLQFSTLKEISGGSGFLNLYFGAIMIPSVLIMIKYSGTYKGAWVYKAMPIDRSKPIFTGTMKAFIINLVLPVYALNSLIFTVFFGIRIIPHIIGIFLSYLLLMIITFNMLGTILPFSLSFNDVSKETGKVFLLMLIGGILALIHFLSTLIPFGIYIFIILLLVICYFAWNKVLDVPWDVIKHSYRE